MRAARGFSLIELIVVMSIMAILLMVALPRYQGSVEATRIQALKADLHFMRDAIDRFHDDRGRFPESLKELVDTRYLRSIPVDPVTERANTWVEVQEQVAGDTVVVDVRSGARGASPTGEAYGGL